MNLRRRLVLVVLAMALTAELGMTVADQALRDTYGMNPAPIALAEPNGPRGSAERVSVGEILEQIGEGSVEVAELRQSRRLTDRSVWDREAHYIAWEGANRQGEGPWVVSQVRDSDDSVPTATKVLAISDSHGWGVGLHDLDQVWARRMEQALNAGTHRDGYRVRNLGRPMTSFYDYVETLTPEEITEMDPDVIVVGYHTNDAVPSGRERMICGPALEVCDAADSKMFPSYRQCLRGEDGLLGRVVKALISPRHPSVSAWILEHYCDIDRLYSQENLPSVKELASHPERNPYTSQFRDAARMLVAAAAGRPVVVVPIWPSVEGNGFLDILREEGLTVVDEATMTSTLALTRHVPNPAAPTLERWDEIQVHPSDCCHFGSVYTALLGEDAARAVREVVGPGPLGSASRADRMVSNYLPSRLTVDDDGVRVTLAMPTSVDVGKGTELGSPAGEDEPQLVPCASQGRPHVMVMLDTDDVSGRTLRVTLTRTAAPLLVATTGYDRENRWVTSAYRTLTPGGSFTFSAGVGATGLVIAGEQVGCPLGETMTIQPFVLEVEQLG